MAVNVTDQVVCDRYALYNGDCIEIMPDLPNESIHLSVYSPPFCGLYNYSSSSRDLSNCRSKSEFFDHYEFLVREIHRVTLPGRISCVHCMDVPRPGDRGLDDFPGDIIRMHERLGWYFIARHSVWKEPLGVRNRTMTIGLAHKQVVNDASLCDVAGADYLLLFRKKGKNPIPIAHPEGLTEYAGEREIPGELMRYRNWDGPQVENRYSHWIWRQYASAFWDDVRIGRVLPYKEARDPEDEKHVHPLQLDVIERCVVLRSNPGETLLTPFMGVGSEVYGALINGRRGVGIELKPTYYNQAKRNVKLALENEREQSLFPEMA